MEVTVLLGRLCSVSQSSTRKSTGAATAPRLAQKNDPATRLVKTSRCHGHGNFGCVTGKSVTPQMEKTNGKGLWIVLERGLSQAAFRQKSGNCRCVQGFICLAGQCLAT